MQLTLAATSKQIMVSYTAPDTNVCTVEVSESASYSPVVDDVNATLFTGANQDNRTGSLGTGTTGRTFLVGTAPDLKGVIGNLANDGNRYGRLLQPGTTHNIRVTCGATVATGSIATKNRPLGITRSWERPMASAGVYAYPTIDTNRNQVLSDPATGIRLRKLSNPSEDTTGGQIGSPNSGAPWTFAQTAIHDSQGVSGYISAWPTEGGSARLYFVTDTVSRFLGTIYLQGGSLAGFNSNLFFGATNPHFGIDPTQLFYMAADGSDQAGNMQVIRCQLPASGNSVYDTSAASGSFAPCTWTNLTATNNITSQLVAFDPTFVPANFSIGSNQIVQGTRMLFTALRGAQDTYGWVGAIDLTTSPAAVVGFAPLWERGGVGALSFRWCGIHTGHPVLGAYQMSFTAKSMYQDVPHSFFTTTLNGAINATQMTITFTSNTPLGHDGSGGYTENIGYGLAAGDEITLPSESMYLGSFISGTTWNIAARGVAGGGTPKAHANGELVLMGCHCHNPNDVTQAGPSWWDYLNDPHGTDTTGTYLITQLANNTTYSGHEGFANNRGIAETGYAAFIGPAMTNNPTFGINDSPDFAGAAKTAAGNSWQKHDAPPQQSNANSSQSPVWGLDAIALDADIQLQQTSLTNITGALWQFVNTNYSLHRKQLAMLALVGSHPLLDISSTATGNVLGGLAADNYKYCVANAVNECRTGSAVGDIYFNAPDVTGSATCYGAMAWGDTTKLCIGHIPAIGDTVVQIGIVEADNNGKWFRSLSDGLMPPKLMGTGADSHATPDGRWATVPTYAPSGNVNIMLVKAPQWPGYDGIDRNTFIQKTVTLGGPAASVTAITEFGYDTNLYCTSRSEVCVSAQSNNPYFFASESYTRISCPSGVCTNTIPVIPDRTAYYRHKFYDSGGNLINTSGLFLLAEDSAPVVGSGVAVVVSGQVAVSGPVTIGGPSSAAPRPTFYASPTGSGTSATLANPCSLATAAAGNSGAIPAGSIIYLRGGVYQVDPAGLTFAVAGSGSNTITVYAAYPGERVIITDTNNNPPNIHMANYQRLDGLWLGGTRQTSDTADIFIGAEGGLISNWKQIVNCTMWGYYGGILSGSAQYALLQNNRFVQMGGGSLFHPVYIANSATFPGPAGTNTNHIIMDSNMMVAGGDPNPAIGGGGYALHFFHNNRTGIMTRNRVFGPGNWGSVFEGIGVLEANNFFWDTWHQDGGSVNSSRGLDTEYTASSGMFLNNINYNAYFNAAGIGHPLITVNKNAFLGPDPTVGQNPISLTAGQEAAQIGASATTVNNAIAALRTAFSASPTTILNDATIETNFATLKNITVPNGSPLLNTGQVWFGSPTNVGPDSTAPPSVDDFWSTYRALGLPEYDANGNLIP